MKLFLSLLTLSILTMSLVLPPHGGDEIDSSKDETKVKEAVVSWADATFHAHSDYKFEKFHAFWTEEYEIAYMRSHAYQDMLTDLENDKKNGRFSGTEEAYQKEHDELKAKYDEIQQQAGNMAKRAEYFQISFWSNVQTNDGITVYYEFIVKLDNDYKVFEALINSAIGLKSDKTEIVYKKGADHSMVKKKSDSTINDGGSNVNTGGGNQGGGSVMIKTNTPVDVEVEETEEKDDKKSDKKKKKKDKKRK